MKKILYHLYNHAATGRRQRGLKLQCLRLWLNILTWFINQTRPSHRQAATHTADDIIVSLTSFPARLPQLWKVITIMLHQHCSRPVRVILWLSQEQVPTLADVPDSLRRLQDRGLEIRIMPDDLKPHKKYYYAFSEFPDNKVITIDDDVFYSLHLIENLCSQSDRYPQHVCCNRGRRPVFDSSGQAVPYTQWPILSLSPTTSSHIDFLPTGIGGVLYPPHCASPKIFDLDAIRATCLSADDLWLNLMCRCQETPITHCANNERLVTFWGTQKSGLASSNVKKSNQNDIQIERLSQWAIQHIGCDFFVGWKK